MMMSQAQLLVTCETGILLNGLFRTGKQGSVSNGMKASAPAVLCMGTHAGTACVVALLAAMPPVAPRPELERVFLGQVSHAH